MRIGLLCLSAIPDDPRVRRQGDLLRSAGHDVVAVGLSVGQSVPPDWLYIDANEKYEKIDDVQIITKFDSSTRSRVLNKAKQVHKKIGSPFKFTYKIFNLAAKIRFRVKRAFGLIRLYRNSRYSDILYWELNSNFELLYKAASQQSVDFWIANDWTTLPIVMRLRKEKGTPFGYDTHELAIDEYAHNLKWRLTQRPIISALERSGIVEAEFVTCVSEGIADRLSSVYRLTVRPTVIRNIPNYSATEFRATGTKVNVLYHGIVSPGRALEEIVKSVKQWRPDFFLTIRGPSLSSYIESLRKIAVEEGVIERIIFAPPVAMTDLVREAASFDVGLFAIDGKSEQNRYVLPNKFFEYCMAGLALCVSDLPEMSAIVKSHDLGVLISAPHANQIAHAINSLDRESINLFKQNSLKCAKDLSWERESVKFLNLLARVPPLQPSIK